MEHTRTSLSTHTVSTRIQKTCSACVRFMTMDVQSVQFLSSFVLSIFPSPDQEINTSLIPATHNTGGSLPDLTNIQFPSPLPTPLDPDDSASGLSVSSSTGNLTVGSHTSVALTASSPGKLNKQNHTALPLLFPVLHHFNSHTYCISHFTI